MAEKRKLTYGDRNSSSVRKSRLPLTENRRSNIRSSSAHLNRPSSAKRSNSESIQAGGSASKIGPPSSLRRYGSDYNLSTPNHFLMTPIGRSPVSIRRMTAVGESTRKTKNENSAKILEILQRDEKFYTKLNIQGGLRSMTAKQFITIMEYFIRAISGKDISAVAECKGDTLGGIIHFLRQINCPYMVNKSMLKTPNAPHTFDQIVTILLWLSDFHGMRNDPDGINMPNIKYVRDEELPSAEYTAIFSKDVTKGFQLWSSESEEFVVLQDRLVDDFIGAKMKNRVTSAQELNVLIEQLNVKTSEIRKLPSTVHNERKFEKMESQFMRHEEMEHNLKQSLLRKHDEFASIEIGWKDKNEKLASKKEHISAINHQIERQKASKNDFNETIFKITALKATIDAKRSEIEMLKNEDTTQLIKRARLLSKISSAVSQLNKNTSNIFQVLNTSGLKFSFVLKDFYIEPTASLQQINEIDQKLAEIANNVRIRTKKIFFEIQNMEHRLKILKVEEKILANDLAKHEETYKKCMFESEAIDKKVLMTDAKCLKRITASEQLVSEQNVKKEEILLALEMTKDKANRLDEENKDIMSEGEEKAMELINLKYKMIEDLDEAIKMIDEVIVK